MKTPPPIFLADILEQGECTLYSLCDSPGRLRDGLTVSMLVQYLERHGVRVRQLSVLAGHRRFYSPQELTTLLTREETMLDQLIRGYQSQPDHSRQAQEQFLAGLFNAAEEARRKEENDQEAQYGERLAAGGPCLFLGRIELYPDHLRREIAIELDEAGFPEEGRIEMQQPGVSADAFWRIRDRFFGVNLPSLPGSQDAAVVRKVLVAPRHARSLLFAYGSSGLGTAAVGQLLFAPELQSLLDYPRLQNLLEEYRSAEVFLHVNLDADTQRHRDPGGDADGKKISQIIRSRRHDLMLHAPFNPSTLTVITTPSPPLVPIRQKWIEWFDQPMAGPERLPEQPVFYDFDQTETGGLRCEEERVPGLDRPVRVATFRVNRHGYHTGINEWPVLQDGQTAYRVNGLALDLQRTDLDGQPEEERLLTVQCPWFMVGGQAIREVVRQLSTLAAREPMRPILLTGQTGTGKEVAAHLVFQMQALKLLLQLRRGEDLWPEPVVLGAQMNAVNCASISESLAEAEFFGVSRGTATEVGGRAGCMLSAGEGVIFLDELSFLNAEKLARLLRCLEFPYQVVPVGETEPLPITAQIVLAMSSDPEEMLSRREFLPEMYSRLRSGRVRLPSLEDRVGDIPALLAHLGGGDVLIERIALRWLLSHPEKLGKLNVRALNQFLHGGQRPVITLATLGQEQEYNRMRSLLDGESPGREGDPDCPEYFRFQAHPASEMAQDTLRQYLRLFSSVLTVKSSGFLRHPTGPEALNGSQSSLDSWPKLQEALLKLIQTIQRRGGSQADALFQFLAGWARCRFSGFERNLRHSAQPLVSELIKPAARPARRKSPPPVAESDLPPWVALANPEQVRHLFATNYNTYYKWLNN